MVRLNDNPAALHVHVTAVENRLKRMRNVGSILADIAKLGCSTVEDFISADMEQMRQWVYEVPEKLQFTIFKDMYTRYFSNGGDNYVDGNYNAYELINLLDISVCPYCDNEYLDVVDSHGKKKRTSEIDHFFPKSKYPALAMCFYNLVPCGQNCNGLKLENELGANPHESDIENLTFLYPELPIGIALEEVDPNTCYVNFHPQKGMVRNVRLLKLEQRYRRHASMVHRLLLNAQMYTPEKIDELTLMGCGSRDHIISTVFGPQNPAEKKKALHQKLVKDLTGY